MADKPEVLTTTEARAGTGTHVVRYVLIISIILAIGAMIWTYAAAPTATQQGMVPTGPQDGVTSSAKTQ